MPLSLVRIGLLGWGCAFLISALWPRASLAAAERRVLPPDVLAVFKAHRCRAVDEFAHDGAPFDYQQGTPKHIVAWCTRDWRKPIRSRTYVLVLSFEKPDEPLRQCANEIPDRPRSGNLKLMDAMRISDEIYHLRYLDTGKPIGRRPPFLTDGVLNRNAADGTFELFICVDGRWAHASQPAEADDTPQPLSVSR